MNVTAADHKQFLQRCYQLAKLSGKQVGTNPLVGAVIVHDGRILAEGRYKMYGGAHAEVNALANIKPDNKKLLSQATIYVSLEPCCIYGKTPPCTNALINSGIKEVHIGALDPFPGIAGKGVELLKKVGINVTLHQDGEAEQLISPFVTYHIKKRPFITLKWAKSKHNFIGKADEQIWLTNKKTNIYTHKLRSQIDAILVGTNTAILDDPSLTTRHFPGESPLRLTIDLNNRIPLTNRLLSDEEATVLFTTSKRQLPKHKTQIIVSKETLIKDILGYCYSQKLVNLMVEGGRKLLDSFLKTDLWDQAVVINTEHPLAEGIKAPNCHGKLLHEVKFENDLIQHLSQ